MAPTHRGRDNLGRSTNRARSAAIRGHGRRHRAQTNRSHWADHHDDRDRLRRLGPQVAPRPAARAVVGRPRALARARRLPRGVLQGQQPGEAARPLRPPQRDVGGPVGRPERGGRRRPRHLDRRRRRRVQDAHALVRRRRRPAVEAPARVGGGRPPRERRPRHLPQRGARAALRRAPPRAAVPALVGVGQPGRPPAHAARGAPTTERRRWARCRACRTSRAAAASARCPRATTCSTRRAARLDEPALFEVSVPAGAVAATGCTRRCSAAPPCASPCRPAPSPATSSPSRCLTSLAGRRPRCAPPSPPRRRRHRRRRRTQSAGRGRAAARRGVERRRLGGGAAGGAAGGSSGGRATCRWARCGAR